MSKEEDKKKKKSKEEKERKRKRELGRLSKAKLIQGYMELEGNIKLLRDLNDDMSSDSILREQKLRHTLESLEKKLREMLEIIPRS